MENKNLYLTFSDGSIWRLPINRIATHHADWLFGYLPEEHPTFVDAWKYVIEKYDEDEQNIINWLKKNMEYEDVQPWLLQVKEPDKTYADEFPNMQIEIK